MTVSVIIPFYNLAAYVQPCLDSVVTAVNAWLEGCCRSSAKDSTFIEVICVNDGSTDETGLLLDAYAQNVDLDPTVCHVRVIHKPNGGEGSARNAGLAESQGEWVTFLDGDDVWLAPMVTAFLEIAAQHTGVDIIAFRFQPFEDGMPMPLARMMPDAVRVCDIRAKIPSAAILDVGVFPTFFRREKFRDLAFSSLPLGADRLYVAHCLAKAEQIVLSPSVVHGYRIRPGSMARAHWNERKIISMIDYAAGSLRCLSQSGRQIGRRGMAYLCDVLLSVAPKHIRRMTDDKTNVKKHWRNSLTILEDLPLSFAQRLRSYFARISCGCL